MNKKLTVLMAVYNDTKYLRNSVRSILNQTYNDFEFLIIDDGSTENIKSIINEFNDERIVYKKITHRGLAGALNSGLETAAGDFIARIDSDDLSPPDRFDRQIKYIKQDPEIDVLSGWSVYFDDSKKILFELKPPVSNSKIKKLLDLHNPINHSAVMFKRNKILSEGGYDKSFRCYEDFELWFRLKDKLNYRIIPEVFCYTRYRKDSLTGTGSRNQIYDLLMSNAKTQLEKAAGKKKEYWNTIIFWIEYFYGSKNAVRKLYGNFSIKKTLAYFNTFLPEEEFKKLLELRLRLRLNTGFNDRIKHKKALNNLLN